MAAPEFVDVEKTAVLRRRWLAGALNDERFEVVVEDLAGLPLMRCPVLKLLRRIYELRANVTAYDARYVALAESLDWPLYTADRRLANAPGPRCAIELVGA